MDTLASDRVIIVGGGLAGLYAALKLAPIPVLVISPEVLGQGASSAWAQGGVAAAMDAADSAAEHAADTVRAGAGCVDPLIAASVTADARDHILDLTTLGTPFDRRPDGSYVLSREAAHSAARVVRVRGDQAGAEIMRALIAQVRQTPSIRVLEGMLATGLATREGAVTGVEIRATGDQCAAPITVSGPACLLAGGGSCGLYALTTNPSRILGQVIGMAARAGAVIADAEFVQFHPTAIDCGLDPAPLATEALRGEGAHLVNRHGERFMTGVHPDAELAPRDIVARAIHAQTRAGLRPALDTRVALGARLTTEFPAVADACARTGIDPLRQPIPLAAAAHHHMGGVATDADGRASLRNLWVCGEASSTGLHGANRLASNGLLEALVYARRCARGIAQAVDGRTGAAQSSSQPAPLPATAEPSPEAVARLRGLMTANVGVIRDADGLHMALAGIAAVEAMQPHSAELHNMTATATLIAAAALLRTESRGAHFRADHPVPTATPGVRSRLTLAQALDLRAEFEPEPYP